MNWTFVRSRFGDLPMRTKTLAELGLREHQWVESNATILAICAHVRSEYVATRLIENVRRFVRSIRPDKLYGYRIFLTAKQRGFPWNDWS